MTLGIVYILAEPAVDLLGEGGQMDDLLVPAEYGLWEGRVTGRLLGQ